MKTFKSIYAVALLAIGLFFVTSCSKDNSLTDNQTAQFSLSNAQLTSDVTIANGMLVFNKVADFQATVLALNEMSQTEIATWEAQVGFTSAATTFQQIMNAEAETEGANRSSIYNENLANNLIVALADGTYELNIFNPAYATVLNGDFKVQVAEDIYEYTNNSLKVWTNGEFTEHVVRTEEVDFRNNTFSQSAACASEGDSGNTRLEFTMEFYSEIEDASTSETVTKQHGLFVDMVLTIRATTTDLLNNTDFDQNASTRGFYYYEGMASYMDDDKVRTTMTVEEEENFERTGGFVTILPKFNGEFLAPRGSNWLRPAHLIGFKANAQSQISNGLLKETLSCELDL